MAKAARPERLSLLRFFLVVHVVGIAAFSFTHMYMFPRRQTHAVDAATVSTARIRDASMNTTTPTSLKPILYIHFHKSGGTSVCETFRASSLVITDDEGLPVNDSDLRKYNCNTPFSGPHHDIVEIAPLQNCQHLIPYTTDEFGTPFRRNNFIAVEAVFKDEMPCGGFRSFAIMRHPVARFKSHMDAHRLQEATVQQWIGHKTRRKSYLLGYPVVNNYVIRQLLGRKRFMDTRPINEKDLKHAKYLIDRFDAFVPLEYLHHAHVKQLLREKVPEYYKGLQELDLTKNVNKKRQRALSSPFLQRITEENKYDIMLYEFMLERLGIAARKGTTAVT